ncbi:MAG: DUF362 domain-containing protein, partial [Candidatus Bathyarchaeota archaeon]
DSGISALFSLMQSRGLFFFNTLDNPTGLIAKDDVVLIKVNAVGPERSGTNTDLVKSLINKILSHPDGFKGEIVVADNGQFGECLDLAKSNAHDSSQSVQDVINSFSSSKISAWSWYTRAHTVVNEYSRGDFDDGYVVNSTENLDTHVRVSYPKFTTKFGTHISFKHGIWNSTASSYNTTKLKVINVPILKSHGLYGVTACIKNYMGVVSQDLTDTHSRIKYGALGTVIAQTRFPTLNLLDAIWVNPNPKEGSGKCGPMTPYEAASFTNVIGASQDPVALEYWASKNILIPAAVAIGYTSYSSLDPDFEPVTSGLIESYHNYLERSIEELEKADHLVTMKEAEMNIYVATKTFPDVHQGDINLKDNNIYVIEGTFHINGSIIVEENATLILNNAIINFTQPSSRTYNITFRNPVDGRPRLMATNTTITSKFDVPIYFFQNSTGKIVNCTFQKVYSFHHEHSYVSISNSTINNFIWLYDSSHLDIFNSMINEVINYDSPTAVISECRLHSLFIGARSVNCSILNTNPGYITLWNYLTNCSIDTTMGIGAPNITLHNTTITELGFGFYGSSKATIINAQVSTVASFDTSKISITDSDITLDFTASNNSVIYSVNSSSPPNINIHAEASIHLGWYLDAQVTDSLAQDVPNAFVKTSYITDPGIIIVSGHTDDEGSLRLTLWEKMLNATGEYSFGTYSVEATYKAHSASTSVKMIENKQVILTLKDLIIPEFPAILLLLPLLTATTLLTKALLKRKHKKK